MTQRCHPFGAGSDSNPFQAVASRAGSTTGEQCPRLIVPCASPERSNENLTNRWHDHTSEAVPGFSSLTPP